MAKKREKERKSYDWFNFNTAMFFLLILLLFAIIKAIIPESDLELEAEMLLDTLTNENGKASLLSSNELLEEKVRELDEMDYEEMKNILGLKQDFCIFFEDVTGAVIKIADVNSGIGSGKIYVNGNPCK